jgi:hypothetical protein
MRRYLLCVFVLAVASARVEAACVDPAMFVHSTVSIERDFSEEESKTLSGVVGIRGTAWFLAPRLLVTVAHVAEAMHLSAQEWKEVEVRDGDNKSTVQARILRLAGSSAEKIAVLELQSVIPGAAVLQSRMEPLTPEERVVSLAYPKNQLRFAGGRFVRYGDGDKFAGTALLEMHDGDDRLVLDHGASGAAVLDCDGRVVAVVSVVMTQTITFFSNAIRVSTPWQSPNVLSIPIQELKGFSWPE